MNVNLTSKWLVIAVLQLFCLYLPSQDAAAQAPGGGASSKAAAVIENAGTAALMAYQSGKLAEFRTLVSELEQLRLQQGFSSLEEQSFQFLTLARTAAGQGDLSAAKELYEAALRLSPTEAAVRLQSIDLAYASAGAFFAMGQLFEGLRCAVRDPSVALRFLTPFVYPLLWALTAGVYLVFVFHFILRMPLLFRRMLSFCPGGLAGIIAPVLLLALLITPCVFGPLLALAVWSLLAVICLPEDRRLALTAVLVLILWGSLVPLRERVSSALSEPALQRALSASAGNSDPADLDLVAALLQRRSADGALWFTYGQLLAHAGDPAAAEKALLRAEQLLGRQGWTKAALGAVALQVGEKQKADSLYTEAEALGLDSAEFYLQFSKVRAALLDIDGAGRYFDLAKEKDPLLAGTVLTEEAASGKLAPSRNLEISLPASYMLQTVLHSSPSSESNSRERLKVLFGIESAAVVGTGLGLLLLIVLAARRHPRVERFKAYYVDYTVPAVLELLARIIPGAIFVLKRRPLAGLFCLSLAAFLVGGVLQWPADNQVWISFLVGFEEVYVGFSVAVCLTLITVAAYLTQEGR